MKLIPDNDCTSIEKEILVPNRVKRECCEMDQRKFCRYPTNFECTVAKWRI